MSSIILNRGNVDVTDLEIEQGGSNASEIMTEFPLLDSTKDYVMGVTACVVPLTEEPMLTYDITSAQLFTIRRRKNAAAPNSAADQLDFIGPAVASAGKESCTIVPGYKFFSITDLVTFLANWTAIVSNAISDMGLSQDGAGNTINCNVVIPRNHASIDRRAGGNTGRRLLGVSLTPGGTLQFVGSPIFWNNFYIVSNSYCREILGFQPIISVSYTNNQVNSLPQNLIAGEPAAILVQAVPLPATHPDQDVNADYTIFRKTEERMLISMEVDLTVPMNLSIVNGLETRTHTVFTAPLQSDIISTVTAGNGVIQDTTNLTLTALQGRVHLLKKTNGNVQWYPLKSSYMIQNSRCSLYMTRRRWSMLNNNWFTDRQPFKVAKDGVWNASLKFVSVF